MIRAELGVGDVVRIVGGGPSMTVEGVDEHTVRCLWFDDLGHVQRGDFLRSTLVKREDRERRPPATSVPGSGTGASS